ncbi:MAG TPA: hypothetical protein VGN26_12265 [Armatimonadota bacterium]|jgi:hypothetical protein
MANNFSNLFNQSTKVVAQCNGCASVNQYQECDLWVHPGEKWEEPEGCPSYTSQVTEGGSGDPDPEEPMDY